MYLFHIPRMTFAPIPYESCPCSYCQWLLLRVLVHHVMTCANTNGSLALYGPNSIKSPSPLPHNHVSMRLWQRSNVTSFHTCPKLRCANAKNFARPWRHNSIKARGPEASIGPHWHRNLNISTSRQEAVLSHHGQLYPQSNLALL
jgi:hypothetical protein